MRGSTVGASVKRYKINEASATKAPTTTPGTLAKNV